MATELPSGRSAGPATFATRSGSDDGRVWLLPFIPDLVAAYDLFPAESPRVLLESADRRGYSYVCGGREAEDLIIGDDQSAGRRGASIESIRRSVEAAPAVASLPEVALPDGLFTGGAIGYLAYDFARTLERLPARAHDDLGTPLAHFFFPALVLIADHENSLSWLVVRPELDRDRPGGDPVDPVVLIDRLRELPRHAAPQQRTAGGRVLEEMPANYAASMSEAAFLDGSARAIEYVRAGDIFQVNLSLRLATAFDAEPGDLYRTLRLMNPSPYMTLVEFDDLAVVGASPEQLLRVERREIATRPIAGTRRRGRSRAEEEAKERELLDSRKEQAEHLMLVDLERNDIGRVAEFGTVRVDEFMTLERYSHVVHIVSNVVGRLAAGRDRFDALGALFPGGTITGAPKVRAMEIIEEIEPVRRGIYTGSIGWIGYAEAMEMNIAIRSIVVKNGHAYVQGGAGIVADSVPALEYREALKKVSASVEALDQLTGRRR